MSAETLGQQPPTQLASRVRVLSEGGTLRPPFLRQRTCLRDSETKAIGIRIQAAYGGSCRRASCCPIQAVADLNKQPLVAHASQVATGNPYVRQIARPHHLALLRQGDGQLPQ